MPDALRDLEADLSRMRTLIDRLRADAADLHHPLDVKERSLLEEVEQSYDDALANLERVRAEAARDLEDLPQDLKRTWRDLREAAGRLAAHRERKH